MATVLVPRASGVLSALGLAISDVRRDYGRTLLGAARRARPRGRWRRPSAALEERRAADLDEPALRRRADLRYRRQAFELTVEADDLDALADRFHAAHEQRYGYRMDEEPVELVNLRLVATVAVPNARSWPRTSRRPATPRPRAAHGATSTATGRTRPVLRARRPRPRLARGGPGDRRVRRGDLPGAAGLGGRDRRRRHARAGADVSDERSIPSRCPSWPSALAGIAEEMGAVLVRGAYSSNIKERRDCSAALFDARGRMVAQAEHIPVHLGAMPESVAAVLEHDPEPGDVWILNDPYRGGTHLPDITAVAPVALDGEIAGYAVTRAHHSDVGGMSPGSMPADSRDIWQEGLVIPPLAARARRRARRRTCSTCCWPTCARRSCGAATCARRSPPNRVAEQRGSPSWSSGAAASWSRPPSPRCSPTRSGARARRSPRMPDGTYAAQGEIEGDGVVDEDIPIAVAVDRRRRRAADRLRGHLRSRWRATSTARSRSRARPACSRCASCSRATCRPTRARSRPLTIAAPEGSLVNAAPAGGRGGRQRRDLPADRRHRAARARRGGRPARPGPGHDEQPDHRRARLDVLRDDRRRPGRERGRAPGRPASTSGMTNTLNTPVEALELEYPLRVERYELLRRLGRRRPPPRRRRPRAGRARARARGGEPALRPPPPRAAGRGGRRARPAGREPRRRRGAAAEGARELAAGDVVELRTPGGGGWGEP